MEEQLRDLERVLRIIGKRQPYQPAWRSSGTQPTLGNGVLTGSYVEIGSWMVVQLRLAVGSTTTIGTGTYTFSLPRGAVSGVRSWNGSVLLNDVSAPLNYVGLSYLNADAAVSDAFSVYFDQFNGPMSNTVPVALATDDQLVATIGYPLE